MQLPGHLLCTTLRALFTISALIIGLSLTDSNGLLKTFGDMGTHLSSIPYVTFRCKRGLHCTR